MNDILDRLEELASKEDEITLGHVVEALGSRSYGPFLLIPPLIDISPVGGIPGLPTLLGAIIILASVQILLGRKHLWLPNFLVRRRLSSEKTRKTTKKLRGVARFLDSWFYGRLPRLTQGVFVKVAAVCCIVLAATIPPLELLPFATTAPMAAIASFGLALLVRDGVLIITGIMLTAAALAFGLGMLSSGGGAGG